MKSIRLRVLPVSVTLGLLCVLLGLVVPARVAHASDTWSATRIHERGPLVPHTATLLQSGQVLVAGGVNNSSGDLASAELYDPTTGSWSATGSMSVARELHTATLLKSGQVLVAGGLNDRSGALTSAELYDPTTGTWSAAGSMSEARTFPTATLLKSGQVLVAGGYNNDSGPLASAEQFTLDTTAPTLSLPGTITVDATSPQGAAVPYTVSASDPDDPSAQLTIGCSLASGSTFPIGTTTVTCTASDPSGNSSSGSFQMVVNPVLTASGKNVSSTEGSAFTGVVTTGTDETANPLTASITWGDGSTSAGTITRNSNGSYSVSGSHTYAEEGSYALSVTVTDGTLKATGSGSATVSDAALSASTPTVVIKGVAVALLTSFTDADPNGTLSDYTASISWGDGSTSAATLGKNASGSGFVAVGAHNYVKHGTYTLTVTIKDAGGSTLTKTVSIKV